MDSAKILFITTGLRRGGAEAALTRIVTHPSILELNPVVISLSDGGPGEDQLRSAGIRVETTNLQRGRIPTPAEVFRFVSLVRKYNPKITQGWMYHGNLAAWMERTLGGGFKRHVLWGIRHALHAPETDKKSTLRLIRFGAYIGWMTDRIIYNSSISAQQHEALGYPKSKTEIIRNGVNSNEFKPDLAIRNAVRESLGIAESDVIVGTCARYHPIKDFPTLIKTVAEVTQRNAGGKRIVFLLAGDGAEKSNSDLVDLIEKSGVTGNVILHGPAKTTAALIPAFDIALMTSRSEASPNAVLEALSCGVPAVVTAVGDCSIMVEGGGIAVPSGDSVGLAEAVIKLASNSALRNDLGAHGRKKAMTVYNLDACVGQYRSLYDKLLAS